jgi:copper transport outer membrane protein MctB
VFDLRYHVVSLTAVFVALVFGILVGVGLSGRGLIKETERAKLQLQIDDLRRADKRSQARIRELESASEYQRETYDAVMEGRLDSRKIAVVYVGEADGAVRTSVDQAVDDANGAVSRLRELKVPIEELRLRAALRNVPEAPQSLSEIGRTLAAELLDGGETPLWDALSNLLVLDGPGNMRFPVDGVVVSRGGNPQHGATARFLAGFYRGLASGGVPAVVVEKSDEEPTTIPPFDSAGFVSSVDNVDTQTGRVSLAVLLQGAETGHFGIKDGKEPVPPVPPVVLSSG